MFPFFVVPLHRQKDKETKSSIGYDIIKVLVKGKKEIVSSLVKGERKQRNRNIMIQ